MDRVVGIDISKARLDACCLASGRRMVVANDAAGVAELAAVVNALRVPSSPLSALLTSLRGIGHRPMPRASWPRPIGSTPR